MFNRTIFAALSLIAASTYPLQSQAGFAVDFGPFDFHVGGGVAIGDVRVYQDPVCRAIAENDLVEVFLEVEGEEGEKSPAVSRLIIEPYALGYNKEGELILRGYQVEGFAVAEEAPAETDKGAGYVGGVYTTFEGSDTKKSINISKIKSIRPLENTNFIIRSDEEFGKHEGDEEIVETLCAI